MTRPIAQVRSLCYQYALLHPLQLLEEQPGNEKYKSLVRAKLNELFMIIEITGDDINNKTDEFNRQYFYYFA